MFQVLQNGKPADCHHYKVGSDWNNSTFPTFEEAKKYAFHWAYPYSLEECEKMAQASNMQLNTPTDLSMCECPLWMEIRQVN